MVYKLFDIKARGEMVREDKLPTVVEVYDIRSPEFRKRVWFPSLFCTVDVLTGGSRT